MGERVSTGYSELDSLIEGGFPKNSMILLAGNAGVGKTILSAKFIYDGAVKGERGVYACFTETKRKFTQNLRKFGLDFEDMISERMVSILDLSVTTEIDVQSAVNRIFEEIVNLQARRLVLDSLSAMYMGLKSELERRHLTSLIYRIIQKTECTAILIVDIPWGSKRIGEEFEEAIADGIILLESMYEGEGILKRYLRILKMRGSNHTKKTYSYVISERGLEIKV